MDYYAPRRWDDPDSDSDSNEDEKTESAEDIEAYYSAQCELKHLPFQVFCFFVQSGIMSTLYLNECVYVFCVGLHSTGSFCRGSF